MQMRIVPALRWLSAVVVVCLITPSGLSQSPSPAALILHETVETTPDRFLVCVDISGTSLRGAYMPRGVVSQLSRSFRDETGKVDYPKQTTPPSVPPNPPPSNLESSFSILEGATQVRACVPFIYADFSVDQIHIQTTFRSWLSRNAEMPEAVRKMIESGAMAPPPYSDESFVSNVCVLDRMKKQARCS
jgi:hypothetical protein